MTVEGLFNNLPVRRRELERNIKREWNRVIGVLNQYACILTGVKFSVSQQPNKGKKIVLFSTRGNTTTRENIVNVFGAKTLTVLVPLELELELESTSTPNQRWRTQDDGGTKEIKVRGHVSRPTHGEGRQTPDRQMFFVNGRPCGLPQFAKVFNEVYKTYNSSQSPFIFADIQLDTHLYDVNVSPDKRTILLHDQSRLLDNLRELLIALFEAQDYSVPLSQLGGPKQTPFKKLAIGQQNPLDREGETDKSPSTRTQDSGVERQTVSEKAAIPLSDDGGNGDDVGVAETPEPENAVPDRSLGQDGQSSNLINRRKDGKSEMREETDPTISPPAPVEPEENSSRFRKEIENEETAAPQDARYTSRRVADFNACMDALSHGRTTTETAEIENRNMEMTEPPIPSIATPSRTSEIKNIIWSPPRVKRTAPEIATITIDGETVTSAIGTPAKKVRTDDSNVHNLRAQAGTTKHTPSIPSFQGRLTQMFSASSSSRSRPKDLEITREVVAAPIESGSPSEASEASEGLFVENDEDVEGVRSQMPFQDENTNKGYQESVSTPGVVDDHDQEGEDEVPASDPSHGEDDDYIGEEAKKAQDESRVQHMIEVAEDTAKATSEETQKRQQSFVKGTTKRKDATTQVLQRLRLDTNQIRGDIAAWEDTMARAISASHLDFAAGSIEREDAEEKLSLTISKSDFGRMKVVGQFNLGFILAVRQAEMNSDNAENRDTADDELFIVDQHATDEKYNFERLQATTVVQSQRLVQPKALELTAIEEEVIKENIEALEKNGFQVSIDESGYQPVGSRCQLLSLPLSRETTFTLADLEELISLLTDHQSTSANTIPRPSRVRKMFAMRACRSSVMIGKSLTNKQMEKLVRHMGELDKPWNCPHGRPTMRHLCGLGAWNESIWQEGDGLNGEQGVSTDWAAYLKENNEE